MIKNKKAINEYNTYLPLAPPKDRQETYCVFYKKGCNINLDFMDTIAKNSPSLWSWRIHKPLENAIRKLQQNDQE